MKNMGFRERLEQHWLIVTLVVVAVAVGTTWSVLNEVLVRPRDEEFARLQRRLEELEAREQREQTGAGSPEFSSGTSIEETPGAETTSSPVLHSEEEPLERDAEVRNSSATLESRELASSPARVQELTRQLSEKEEELQHLRRQAVPTAQEASSTSSDHGDSGAPSQPIATAREQGFEFNLMQCTDEGSSIRCDVIVTNQHPDRWVGVSSGYASRTYLVDTEGNKCSASDSTSISNKLAQGVPLRVTVEFTKCPRNVTRLSYLELGVNLGYLGTGDKFKVPFRDVPVNSD